MAHWHLMKEIVPPDYDEHEYDPRTSEMLATWRPGEESSVFRHESETLYKTAKGNYFILFEGGLLSRSRSLPGTEIWYGGSSIHPLNAREAFSWCQETGNFETIDAHFFFLK
ncbi:MAG: hypothetical protein BWZ01_02103 [Deltaproteobacteria bacterium ADurb.BinA179]|nr:hypothetical protein [Deltaproteobacteria bacterium]MDI9543735.1 hypothetical protein [Pseudomonadota bacterium]OPZ26435.1 MAG: hypothetical protein BWZ01_02103 [Deltaproteobacteria bacterium ADurb.BinA179]HNU74974.1 hypothetical protein [Deltaproteobacteria bacterium]HOD71594.1 hypothetical protein [Deltaproteobacteria bacterium]